MKLSVNQVKLTGVWATELCYYEKQELLGLLRNRSLLKKCQNARGNEELLSARVNPFFVEKKLLLQSGNLNETSTTAKSLPTQLCIVWNHPQLLKEIYLVCTICTLINNKFNNGTCTLHKLQAE